MGNLPSLFKKQNHNLILDKKCIHCSELFSSAKKRRKHEITCASNSNNGRDLDIYTDSIYLS